MSPIVTVCIVLVTVALIALAYMATRLIIRLDAMTQTLEVGFVHLEEIVEEVRMTSGRINEVIDVADDTVRSLRRGALRVERVVDQATSVSSAVLEEFERPVQQASALLRGLEAGVALLGKRWNNGRSPHTR